MIETARDLVVRTGGATLDLLGMLDPLVAHEHELAASLVGHGWRPPPAGQAAPLISGWPTPAQRAALRAKLDQLRLAGTPTLAAIGPVAKDVGTLAGKVRLAQPPGAGAVAPFDKPRFWQTYPGELADELIASYFEDNHPAIFALLHLSGVIESVERPAEPAAGRMSSRGDRVAWSSLADTLTDPGARFAAAYGWGGDLAAAKLTDAVIRVARALGVEAHARRPPQNLIERYFDQTNPHLRGLAAAQIALMRMNDLATGYAELSLLALPIPERAQRAGAPRGLWIGLTGSAGFGLQVPLSASARLVLRGAAADALPPGIELLPSGAGISMPSPPAQIDVAVGVDVTPPQPWRPLGVAIGTRLEIEGASAAIEARGAPADLELRARLAARKVRLFVDLGDADGFVSRLVPPPPALELDAALVWSSKTGLAFEGQAALELRVPLGTRIGPAELIDVLLALRPGTANGAGELIAAVSAKAALGPVDVSVRSIGARARLTPASDPAALVAFDQLGVSFGFKAPDGAALKIDGGAVTGAGFLVFDEARQQYAGGVDLDFARLRLSAIGLLATRMPDGRPGFSLLVVINARFPKPIPLGFGFNLSAVGGIVGINRSVDVARMRASLKAGSLSTILAPGDVVGNQNRLLEDLSTLFPVTPGRHLFGPTAQLTWGTPTVVTMDLGLALELPRPLRFIAAGRVRVLLPDERAPIAKLNLDALGVLDTGAGTLELDAVLYDSQLAGWQLSGDMALRARWMAPAQFAFSIGGFHPRFEPPPNFPALRRMALSIGKGKVQLRLEAYLALTSNTLQLGSRVQLDAESGDFSARGHFSFDALVRFSPFGFEIDLSLAVAIRWKSHLLLGIAAAVFISGPGRWTVRGEAHVDFLFIHATVRFKGEFGQAQQLPPAPPQDVLALVRDALASEGAWRVEERAPLAALTLRQGIDAGGLLVSPSAQISARQKVAPLGGTHLDRFGQAGVAGARELRISAAKLGGAGTDIADVKDEFSPAQFFDMGDEEKLTAPSFDLMASGVAFTATETLAYDTSGPAPVAIGYETFVVGGDAPAAARGLSAAPAALSGADLDRLAHFGAAGRAQTRATGLARFAAAGVDVRVAPDAFVVVATATLEPAGPQPAAGERWSRSEAQQRLRRWRVQHPQDDLTVVAATESA